MHIRISSPKACKTPRISAACRFRIFSIYIIPYCNVKFKHLQQCFQLFYLFLASRQSTCSFFTKAGAQGMFHVKHFSSQLAIQSQVFHSSLNAFCLQVQGAPLDRFAIIKAKLKSFDRARLCKFHIKVTKRINQIHLGQSRQEATRPY